MSTSDEAEAFLAKDRSYRATPLGLEVARYYRWKKNEWGATKDTLRDQGKRWISVPRIQVEREKREAKKAGS